jgi:hypothetical protein
MSRRLFIAMLGFSLALFLMPQISLAEEDHIDEAIKHTKQAIVQGHAGHTDSFLATPRKRSSKRDAAENANANPHTEEAITHLDRAIAEGKQGHDAAGTTQAEVALSIWNRPSRSRGL